MKKYLLSLLTVFISHFVYAQLAVTTNNNALQLAQSLSGQGVVITNPTLTCGTSSSGTFTATGLGIGSGIVLSTGTADDGQTGSEGTGSGNNTSDPNITTITTGIQKDVCKLEFDVTPNCNKLDVSYVFASKEYPDYVCSTYNDAFGFFISGAGIVGTQNMAVIPGTTTGVSINTVNSGNVGSAGSSGGCPTNTYSNLYVDNPQPFFPWSPQPPIKYYGGFTTPLKATATVQACSTYHVKIVIADIIDAALNSAIFLQNNAVSCNPIINVVASNDTSICPGSSATLSVTGTAGNVYTWSPAATLSDTTGNSVVASPTLTTTYYVSTPITGCAGVLAVIKDSVTVTMLSGSLTPAVITTVAPICLPNASLNLAANVAGGTWSGTGVTNTATGVFDPNVAGVGNHLITYIVNGACGNTQDTIIITVSNGIMPTITVPYSMCPQDAATTLTASVAGGTWSGTGITNVSTGVFKPMVAGVGTHTITYTLTTGCGASVSKNIIVKNAIAPVLCADTSICSKDTATLYIKNIALLHNVIWANATGIQLVGNGPLVVTPTAPQKYYVTAFDTANCAGVDSVVVKINPLPKAIFSPTEVCYNTPTVFVNHSIGAPKGYLTFGDGFSDSLNTTLTHTYGTAGPFFANYICISDSGCRDTAQVQVNVNPNPQVMFVADTTKGCAPLCVIFTNTSTTTSYTWWANGVKFSALNNPAYCVNVGTTTITLIGTDAKGCKDTLTKINYLLAYPTPKVNISVDPAVTSMLNPDVTIINNSDVANNTHYYWNLGDTTLYTNTLQSLYYTYKDTGHYKITQIAQNKFGCADTGFAYLFIEPMVSMYIPNAFTPNADGLNDYFNIKGVGLVDYELTIFDRWGTRVSTVKYGDTIGWDGKYLKTPNDCKQDYYVWNLSYKTLKKDTYYKSGTVTLLR